MNATVSQGDLNKGLTLASRMVASRGQLPVLGNVLIEAEKETIILSATNLEIGVRVNIKGQVKEGGAITIPAKTLGEFVNSLSEGSVEMETIGEKLRVERGKSRGDFTGIIASEFPVMPKMGGKETIKINRQMIGNVAGEVAFAAATDESRPVLTGVQFKAMGKRLTVTATDGFRLSRKVINIANEMPGLEKGLILPARTIQELARISGEGRKEEIVMEVAGENNQVIFEYDGVELISRILEGNFPDVDKIIPVEFKSEVKVDKEELTRAVRAGSIFARENSNIIRFKAGEGKLKLESSGQQTGDSEVEVEAQQEGDESIIAFNYRYLLDYLGNVKGERVNLKLNGSLAPGVFGIEGNEGLVHLIMPVRI